jgi:hypothetical protein
MFAPLGAQVSGKERRYSFVSVLTPVLPVSRAVLRAVEPGSDAVCGPCGEQVRFVARSKARQVIANVYVNERWDRVEHFHEACYLEAGEPYGPAKA